MINVTKPYLPSFEKYNERIQGIWERNYLTNQGPELLSLEDRLKEYLGVNHIMVVNNGTIALQIAIKALGITGEVITTPFSYVATTNSLIWENCKPVFVDINEHDCSINPELIEAAITPKTTAIMAVHVYGTPADVEAIDRIAKKHNLKVVYDAAHAFGVQYRGTSVLNFGDISTLSFHATKLFHTIEGGAIIVKDPEVYDIVRKLGTFGHVGDDYYLPGINGKMNEFCAAMGHCVLDEVDSILTGRKRAFEQYESGLKDVQGVALPACNLSEGSTNNHAYFPIVFQDELTLLRVISRLNTRGVYPRRYFFPSLNTLPYVNPSSCPVSESISSRVLCAPLYPGLGEDQIAGIIDTIKQTLV